MFLKKFHILLIVRVILLAFCFWLVNYAWMNEYYLRAAYVLILAIALVIELISFIARFTTNLQTFFQSIAQRDFTFRIPGRQADLLDEVYESMNTVTRIFREIHLEKEIRQRYLETLIEHISFGIISVDATGNVILVNRVFLELAGVQGLSTLASLQRTNKQLGEAIQQLDPGRKKSVRLQQGHHNLTLSLYATAFRLDQKEYRIISVQNISHEMSAAEMEAWQRLTRVLTHEIMNSVSPIISLSGTLRAVTERNQHKFADGKTLHEGLEAIHLRSEGLLSFTKRYRELAQIPAPVFQVVPAGELVDRIIQLVKTDLNERNITLRTDLPLIEVAVDPVLMEQVLLNIIRNAMDALQEIQDPIIDIRVKKYHDKVHFVIRDNGAGIDPLHLDKIFVPFFTTRPNGSGIGLAVSRQIVLLHGGDIFCVSSVGEGSAFSVVI